MASVKTTDARLRQVYYRDVVPALKKKFQYSNLYAIPRLAKIVVNMGVGDSLQNIKLLDAAVAELAVITGQKPIVTRARKSIAAFKLREGNPIGAAVTLRGQRMYEFYDRLVNIALPRVRDFRGVPNRSFDGRGNYTLGLKDQLVFLEINYSKVEQVRGMNVTLVTTAKTDAEAHELLRLMGMPFRREAA